VKSDWAKDRFQLDRRTAQMPKTSPACGAARRSIGSTGAVCPSLHCRSSQTPHLAIEMFFRLLGLAQLGRQAIEHSIQLCMKLFATLGRDYTAHTNLIRVLGNWKSRANS
jgi:hypothetical protein